MLRSCSIVRILLNIRAIYELLPVDIDALSRIGRYNSAAIVLVVFDEEELRPIIENRPNLDIGAVNETGSAYIHRHGWVLGINDEVVSLVNRSSQRNHAPWP